MAEENDMTIEEFEKLAEGMRTGYKDRTGRDIRVGDEVIYYRKSSRRLRSDEDPNCIEEKYHYGHEYVYTGKVRRSRYTVQFSFAHGVDILGGSFKYAYYHEKDKHGNLITILIDNERKNPKIEFDDLIPYKPY